VRPKRNQPSTIGAHQQSESRPADRSQARELLLLLGTEREILARIVPEDPLGILPRASRRLREEHLAMDVDRVALRAFALCASRASAWRGRPGLGAWLDERVDEAIAGLQREDRARLASSAPAAPGGAFSTFAAPLGLDAAALGHACTRLNSLPRGDREALYLFAVDGQSPEHIDADRGHTVSEYGRRARRALDVLRGAALSDAPSSVSPLGSSPLAV